MIILLLKQIHSLERICVMLNRNILDMKNAQRTVKQLSERLNESTHIFTTYAQVSNLQLKFMQQ